MSSRASPKLWKAVVGGGEDVGRRGMLRRRRKPLEGEPSKVVLAPLAGRW